MFPNHCTDLWSRRAVGPGPSPPSLPAACRPRWLFLFFHWAMLGAQTASWDSSLLSLLFLHMQFQSTSMSLTVGARPHGQAEAAAVLEPLAPHCATSPLLVVQLSHAFLLSSLLLPLAVSSLHFIIINTSSKYLQYNFKVYQLYYTDQFQTQISSFVWLFVPRFYTKSNLYNAMIFACLEQISFVPSPPIMGLI